MGLYNHVQGQFGTFLYTDPTDNAAANQQIAIPDGVSDSFTFMRNLGPSTGAVSWVTRVSNVFLNGIQQPSIWSLQDPNTTGTLSPVQKFAEDGSANQHVAEQAVPGVPVGTSFTFTVYAKAAEESQIVLFIGDTVTGVDCNFDLKAGTSLGPSPGNLVPISQSITPIGGGWFRLSITSKPALNVELTLALFLDGALAIAGTSGGGVYIFGSNVAVGNETPNFLPAWVSVANGTLTSPNVANPSSWILLQPNQLVFTLGPPIKIPTASNFVAEDGSNGQHLAQTAVSAPLPVGTEVTFFFYAAPAQRTSFVMFVSDSVVGFQAVYNMATGQVQPGTTSSNVMSTSMVPAGNGFFLCSMTFLTTSGLGVQGDIALLEAPNGITSYQGVPGAGAFFTQIEFTLGSAAPANFGIGPSQVIGATLVGGAQPSPAPSGIVADFTYAFQCRFTDDQEDFENFMSGLWKVSSLKFRSVKP